MTDESRSVLGATSGTLCVVHGPKGGCGSSTLAANLAFACASASTLLLDFSLNAGGAGALLDVRPTPDVTLLTRRSERMSEKLFRACTTRHASGLSLFVLAEELEESGGLTPELVDAVLTVARTLHPIVVVDTDHHFSDQTLTALASADQIVVPTTGDIAALRAVTRTLAIYQQLQLDTTRVHVVLNRVMADDPLAPGDVEALLERPLSAVIPEDRRGLGAAMTRGELLQARQPASPVGRAIAALAARLTGAAPVEPTSRLKRLLRRS
jgi:pilus assembly protein CpaE